MPESIGYLPAILLGLIQGISEFLPISSSGHLALAGHLGLRSPNEALVPLGYDLLLHLATVLVVLKAFWGDLVRMLKNERRILLYLVAGSLPAGLAGVFLRETLGGLRENPVAVCIALMGTGAILLVHDHLPRGERILASTGVRRSLVVGLAQALAIIPGISRSGTTITAGAACGLRREAAVRFSFFLMVPAITGGLLIEVLRHPEDLNAVAPGPALAGFLAAFGSGLASLRLLQLLVRRKRLRYFALYCGLVGLGGLLYFTVGI